MTGLTATTNNNDSWSRHLDVVRKKGRHLDEMRRGRVSVDVADLKLRT
jgi:hypothetical protein